LATSSGSKPKFIDVYSKYVPKETTTNRRNFKIYSNKPLHQDKILKTEPDEVAKASISIPHKSKQQSLFNKY